MSSFFADAQAVADYAERTARLVPGLADLQRMAALLLAERTPADARVLVVGAGGGLELELFARVHTAWTFTGVDPSAEMLALAKKRLGASAARVEWHEGYVETASAGPFDAASCLLTLHFVARAERARMLVEIKRRLKPGAPFVSAHLSFAQVEPARASWLNRYVEYAVSSGVDRGKAQVAAATIGAQVPVLSPEQDEELLHGAGFSDIEVFYAGLAFRGWVARA